jgi:hypothetical protein
VAQEQSAFIRGRYILESVVVVAHEVVHSLRRSKEHGVVIKLDYEKTYHMVNLDFLFENCSQEALVRNGLSGLRCWSWGVWKCYGKW